MCKYIVYIYVCVYIVYIIYYYIYINIYIYLCVCMYMYICELAVYSIYVCMCIYIAVFTGCLRSYNSSSHLPRSVPSIVKIFPVFGINQKSGDIEGLNCGKIH